MQLGGGRFRRFAIEPDDQKLSGVDDRIGRESPLRQARIIAAQKITAQSQHVGSGIVKFQPRIEVPRVIGEGVEVVGLNFIQPQRREGGQRRQHVVRRAGRSGIERGLRRLNAVGADNSAAGQTNGQPIAVGAGQIPVTERVLLAVDQWHRVLPHRIRCRRAARGGDQMQTRVAGVFHASADGRGGMVW